MKRTDELLIWSGLHGTRDARVRVRIYDDMVFIGRSVVILTEPEDNPGKSVTNGVEMIAALVCEQFKLNPANVSFFEHYPPRGRDYPETFDTVTFAGGIVEDYRAGLVTIKRFQTPNWSRIEWPALRNSIADRDDPVPVPAASADF